MNWTEDDYMDPADERAEEEANLMARLEAHSEISARCAELLEQFAWVLERDDSPVSEPHYWAAGQIDPTRSSAWTFNHMAAIRFARREDAQAVADRLMKKAGVNVRVCDHLWATP